MNKFEKKMKKEFEKRGWEVLHSGWPDFLLIKRNDAGKVSEIQALEVKSEKDRLRSNQQKMLYTLSEFIPVRLVREGIGYGPPDENFHVSVIKRDLFEE